MPITYCIVCNITGEKYYGSTKTTLKKRLNCHRNKLNCASRQIIQRGDYDVYPLHEYETELEAKMKEGWYIDNKECINKLRVCVTREEKLQSQKEYNKLRKNKEGFLEYKKKYNKEYGVKNRDKILEQKSKKVECEFCKKFVTHLARHKRSERCKQFQ